MTYKENSNVFIKKSEIPCPYIITDILSLCNAHNMSMVVGYYNPMTFTPPPANISGAIEVSFGGYNLCQRGFIYRNSYIYWHSGVDGSMKRVSIENGTIESILNDEIGILADDSSFILFGDASTNLTRVAMYFEYEENNGDNPSDYTYRIRIQDFDSSENTVIGAIPEYSSFEGEDWWNAIPWFITATPNKKIIVSMWRSYVDETNYDYHDFFDFYVYDIDTKNLLLTYTSQECYLYYGNFQYPVAQPVIIGNKVYYSFHFNNSEGENMSGQDSNPIIIEIDTENLTGKDIRPRYPFGVGETIGVFNLSNYDASLDKIVYTFECWGDVYNHEGVMLLNPHDLSYMFSWVTEYDWQNDPDPTDTPMNLLVGPNNIVYLLKKDGTIASATTPTSTIITVPINNYGEWSNDSAMFWGIDQAQPQKFSNIIDNNGILWMCYRCNVRGYNLDGSAPIELTTNIPEPVSDGHNISLLELVYLENGELFVYTKGYSPYGYRAWHIT